MSDEGFIQAGMLPFRIEQCYNELVKSIHENRLNARTLEEQEGKTAIYWAAYLAHYLGDNTQPEHASIDYKNQSYFANKTRSPNVHAEVEYRMCDDEKEDYMDLRKEFWPVFVKQIDAFKDPVKSKDLFQSCLEISMQSYEAMPLIGVAAMCAARQGAPPKNPWRCANHQHRRILPLPRDVHGTGNVGIRNKSDPDRLGGAEDPDDVSQSVGSGQECSDAMNLRSRANCAASDSNCPASRRI